MKKLNILFLGITLLMPLGCNFNNAKKGDKTTENISKESNAENAATNVTYDNVNDADIDTTLLYEIYNIFALSEENDILRTLTNNWANIVNDYNFDDKKWRTKEFITSFFSNENVHDIIIRLLKKDNAYKQSRTNLYVNALIAAYHTIDKGDDELLERLYILAQKGFYENREEIESLLQLLDELDEDIYEAKFSDNVSFGSFHLYSFWARRHHEGNQEVVYALLKKLQREMEEFKESIQDLLDKTEMVQVPLRYAFEDDFNSNVKPLSDEMLSLLSFEKIDIWSRDLENKYWLSRQVNLSNNFKTLIFSILTGGTGENVLVNYTNDFRFIDYKKITFEDYAEGYSSAESYIEKGKIIVYSGWYGDYPETENDTTYFTIDEDGKIDTLIVEKESNAENTSANTAYDNVHESIQEFEYLETILETEKFRIRIDRLQDGSFRYASWSINQGTTEKPDLVLFKGEYIREGTGGNHRYEFINGDYIYECSIRKLRESKTAPAYLIIYKGEERILSQPAEIVK